MRKSIAARVVRALRKQLRAPARQLTPIQTLAPVDGRRRFERLELALYRELAFQFDFFDEEIAVFRTLCCVVAGGAAAPRRPPGVGRRLPRAGPRQAPAPATRRPPHPTGLSPLPKVGAQELAAA